MFNKIHFWLIPTSFQVCGDSIIFPEMPSVQIIVILNIPGKVIER